MIRTTIEGGLRPMNRRLLTPLLALLVLPAFAAPAPAADLTAAELTTEHAVRPLGTDEPAPVLGWQLRGGADGEHQTAYRVLVATAPEKLTPGRADVWDSGRQHSDRSYDVAYDGPALRSRTRYFWRVKVWGRDDATAWSAPTLFETGLLNASDWSASWIGAPPAAAAATFEGASWMWYPEAGDPRSAAPPGERFFRTTVDGAGVRSARLLITVDDAFTAYLNGREVARSITDPEAWRHPQLAELDLQDGENVLAVAARNGTHSNGTQSPAGALVRVELELADGSTRQIEGGDAWRASEQAPDGWLQPGFDDSAWPAARRLASWGESPWGAVAPPAPEQPAPLVRRAFTLAKPVERARLYVAGAAYADVHLNGRRVSDHVMDPGFTRYDERVEYVTHDVTEQLRRGENVLGAELGRGFFGMTTPNVWNWHTVPWHGDQRALLQLEVTHPDGTRTTVASSDGWSWHESPTRFDSQYGGESYDARLAQDGWDAPGFDADGWAPAVELPAPAGRLVAQEHQPMKVMETLRPVRVTNPKPGVHVFALPRNIAGWARLRVHGPEGTALTLRYGEKLNADGTVQSSNNLVTGRFQTDTYTLRGASGTETWEPRFAYKGFQYVQVTGWPGTPTVDDLDGRLVHSDIDGRGEFASDQPLFATVRDLTLKTVLNNWHGIPTDTPMYEKNGWTGDAQLMTETYLFELDAQRLLVKWLDDIRDSVDANGRPPAIAPDGGWGQGSYGAAPPWNAAYVLIPWWLYEYRGDQRVLADHYAAMRRFIDWEIARSPDGIHTSFLGDYLAPGYGGNPAEDLALAGTAYAYEMVATMAKAAGVLGREADAERYRTEAARIRDAFNARYLDTGRGIYRTDRDPGYRQTHSVLALAFGMVPAEHEQAVVDNLVADVRARGDHLNTGALGTKYLLPVLTEHGHGDLAYAVATQRTYPSWGYWVDNGATSLWERWDLNARSRDHAFLGGAIEDWFFKDLAGIRPLQPGFAAFEVRPEPVGDLGQASAATETPYGRAATAWRRDADGSLHLRVQVPAGSRALVHVPAASAADVDAPAGARPEGERDGRPVYEVQSGVHEFEVQR
jgi:alpha-L-rhamnosidase